VSYRETARRSETRRSEGEAPRARDMRNIVASARLRATQRTLHVYPTDYFLPVNGLDLPCLASPRVTATRPRIESWSRDLTTKSHIRFRIDKRNREPFRGSRLSCSPAPFSIVFFSLETRRDARSSEIEEGRTGGGPEKGGLERENVGGEKGNGNGFFFLSRV